MPTGDQKAAPSEKASSYLVKYFYLGRDFRHALRQGNCLKLRGAVLAPVLLALFLAATLCEAAERKTENVILITLDGVHSGNFWWVGSGNTQEPFKGRRGRRHQGLQEILGGVPPATAREADAVFLGDMNERIFGCVYGNQALNSVVRVTNRHRFSYPGYSEILTGEAHDDVINSNDKRRNPYPSVLEFLRRKLVRIQRSRGFFFLGYHELDCRTRRKQPPHQRWLRAVSASPGFGANSASSSSKPSPLGEVSATTSLRSGSLWRICQRINRGSCI